MALTHRNRRGEVYFIQAKLRGGKTAYSAARKPTGEPVDRLPDGYEIYEMPDDAQVLVRKTKPTQILPAETQSAIAAIRRFTQLEYFIVDTEPASIVIYLPDAEPDRSIELMRAIAPMTVDQAHSMRDHMMSRSRYQKMMRFVLTNKAERTFTAERWCFRGRIDNWHHLTGGKLLPELLERYVPHLGKDSFFDLV
ncbi:MAG: hypothetical protein ABSH22_03280 [Tepidisphaeraceae bacterium]|jgi:hypothetical protein